jgi:hypothetical protein
VRAPGANAARELDANAVREIGAVVVGHIGGVAAATRSGARNRPKMARPRGHSARGVVWSCGAGADAGHDRIARSGRAA